MQHQCGQLKTMKSGLSAVSGSVVRIDGCIASMKVAHFFYFSIAARHRSFRRAAIDLNITQPTLSKRIRELEDQFDVLLFERRAGGARLTPPGEKFVQSADRILAELEFMKQSAQAAKRGDLGRIDVGFYTSLSAGALRDTLVAFANQHAEAELNIIEETRAALIPLLDRGAIDIAVVLGEPGYRDYAHMSLWSERIMVVLPETHRLAERDVVYWTDLRNERFVISHRDPGPEINDVLLNKLAAPGDRPLIKHINAHHSVTIGAVRGERGITLACESSFAPLPWVVFRELRDGNGPTRLGFVAYWRRNNDNPTLKQFLALLRAHPAVPHLVSSASMS